MSEVQGQYSTNATDQQTLLPCPFCNCPRVEYDTGAIECWQCAARGPQSEKEYVAAAEWNTRCGGVDRAAVRALVEELLGELQDHGAPAAYVTDVRARLAQMLGGER